MSKEITKHGEKNKTKFFFTKDYRYFVTASGKLLEADFVLQQG